MDRGILFSFVIPVYNVDEYIDACMESILQQTYPNIEVIAIDDGSTDRSSKILDEFSLRDQRVKVVHKANGGVSSARNDGILLCTGDFVIFVDADDMISDRLCEQVLAVLVAEPDIDIVQFNVGLFYRDEDLSKEVGIALKVEIFNRLQAFQSMIRYEKIRHEVWGKALRREIVQQVTFTVGRAMSEDICYTFRCIDKICKCAYTDSVLYFYRARANSATHTYNKKHFQDRLCTCDETYHLITEAYPELAPAISRRYSWDLMMLFNECQKHSECKDICDAIATRMKTVAPAKIEKPKTAVLHWLFLHCRWIYTLLFSLKSIRKR